MVKRAEKNLLLEAVVGIISSLKHGKVLDLGCGDGKTGKRLSDIGFEVEACDMDKDRFQFSESIPFKSGNLNNPIPYDNESFDYLVFMEVIEHIYNPGFVVSEINRVLKPGGTLILSTPNILNISSRLRFLFEGGFDYFREPTLDFAKCFPASIQNMHVIPWRYQELEYLLYRHGLEVSSFYTDKRKVNFLIPAVLFKPIWHLQAKGKDRRAKKKASVSFNRINKILLSDEMLLGRHLILKAVKNRKDIKK